MDRRSRENGVKIKPTAIWPRCAKGSYSNAHRTRGVAMEDDFWSIFALWNGNSLAASVALKKNLVVSMRLSLI